MAVNNLHIFPHEMDRGDKLKGENDILRNVTLTDDHSMI
jgi:hypothetical protein